MVSNTEHVETQKEKYNKLRLECWNNALHSFALSYIFDKKAKKNSFNTNLLKVFGIVVPITVGATAMGYDLDSNTLKLIITLAIPLTIFQLIFSVFAVVYKWDDVLAYSYEASQDLSLLSDEFRKLGNLPPEDYSELDQKFEVLNTRFKSRSQQNTKYNISEKELRKGMRYGLREFQRKCIGCKEIPNSMKSSDCHVCGKF
ncbi:hypothetical protein EJ994_13595 [Maribacter sp. MJ134]|uniref:mobilome CxxCx(11)CxxC protein n=1 Tax=Maribacter sp. MJ134 TaxID=2496865 RepID=UPI000F82C3FB|nr:mobilome CxxCx(11)CxxC protein [Maribacter sp. MJ134]AZQ59779.1 hypothetical protein EJ994_13595 [Maribacter sp. MJ134]